MQLGDLVPQWPSGFDAWEGFCVVVALLLFKAYRATVLKRRSHYIDRFGWSIILFDYVFVLVFAVSLVFSLYPDLRSVTVSRGLLLVLLAVTVWQAVEVWKADTQRVDVAIGGTNGAAPEPTYPEVDRRAPGVLGRRDYDHKGTI